MPTYLYKCTECETVREDFHYMKEHNSVMNLHCENCNKETEMKQTFVGKTQGHLFIPHDAHKKPPEDWRRFLNNLKKGSPGSDFTTY